MLEVLDQNPDTVIVFREDKDATALLLETGIIGKFCKNPFPTEPWFSFVAYGDHCTHFIIGVLFTGYSDPKENGYMAHCLPKSRFSTKQANEWIISTFKQNCDSATLVHMLLSDKQSEN